MSEIKSPSLVFLHHSPFARLGLELLLWSLLFSLTFPLSQGNRKVRIDLKLRLN
jgi:hypothetical protein